MYYHFKSTFNNRLQVDEIRTHLKSNSNVNGYTIMMYPSGHSAIYIQTNQPSTEAKLNSESNTDLLDPWISFHPFNRAMEYRHAEINYPSKMEYEYGGSMTKEEFATADIIPVDDSDSSDSDSS